MKCKGLWYGGSSYANPDPERDLEVFASLAEAGRVTRARSDNYDGRTPCVDDDLCAMHVYFGEYTEDGPDRVISIGPRGGLTIVRA